MFIKFQNPSTTMTEPVPSLSPSLSLTNCCASSALLLKKAANSKPRASASPQHQTNLTIPRTRRDVVTLLSSLAAALSSTQTDAAALAFEFGVSGPKSWLKEQKRKAVKFLLAPIYDSRESLQNVYLLFSDGKNEFSSEDLKQVQKLLRSAARDCVVQERNSFVAFQANTGVEVCTFTLLVKNAASLLEDKNPVKLAAEAKLNNLIRSFTALTDLANEVDIHTASSREKVTDALMDAMSSLDMFEQGIKDCLEI